jgi:hypothetical protein
MAKHKIHNRGRVVFASLLRLEGGARMSLQEVIIIIFERKHRNDMQL